MTTKFKILSTISFIALAVVLTFVGVWALTDLDFIVGGNITYTAPESESILKYDEENGYFYVEMGTYEEKPVIWRLVGLDGNKFTGSTAPTSGTGTFILETYTNTWHVFDETNFSNAYATSDIRTYLTNESSGGYIYDILGITVPETNKIYSEIDARDMTSLYTDIVWNYNTDNSPVNDNYARNEMYTITTSEKGSDKLWLMSVKEVYTLLGGGIIGSDGTIPSTWSQDVKDGCDWDTDNTSDYYWLRSPIPDYGSFITFQIASDGNFFVDDVSYESAVRPAFNLVF